MLTILVFSHRWSFFVVQDRWSIQTFGLLRSKARCNRPRTWSLVLWSDRRETELPRGRGWVWLASISILRCRSLVDCACSRVDLFDSILSGNRFWGGIDAFLHTLQQGSVPAKSDYTKLKSVSWAFHDRGSSSKPRMLQARILVEVLKLSMLGAYIMAFLKAYRPVRRYGTWCFDISLP
jgi:hypothetical protein